MLRRRPTHDEYLQSIYKELSDPGDAWHIGPWEEGSEAEQYSLEEGKVVAVGGKRGLGWRGCLEERM